METDILLHPNPVKNQLNISGLPIGKEFQVKIINIQGQVIKELQTKTNDSFVQLNIENISSGIYNIIIESSTYNFTSKFIKQ